MDLKDKTEKNKHFITSLEFAIQGIKTVFQEERNMRAHVVFGLMAILVASFSFGLWRLSTRFLRMW
jgi:undecaprenol kinase